MKVISGKGKEFSQISKEIEQQIKGWLNASKMTEDEVINFADKNDFEIILIKDNGYCEILLKEQNRMIGVPLIWDEDNGIKYEEFLVDAALILYYFCQKLTNNNSIGNIKKFISSIMEI